MPIATLSPPASLERKFYQLIIARLNGDDIGDPAYRQKIMGLVQKGIGGFIVFGGQRDAIHDFIKELQSLAELPLFIASDVERGVEQQIRGTTPFPCPMATAAAIRVDSPEDMALIEKAIKGVAEEAISVGINMPLLPVADVNQNADNPIICTRAFSDSADTVAWFSALYVQTLEAKGLISCPKHFPGHGDTSVDSHISLPIITKSRRKLIGTDILPFVQGIRRGARGIMIGHLLVPCLDIRPASLSKKVVTELLREELGFQGLVISDALNMRALENFGNVPVECINAGADILLHPEDAESMANDLLAAADEVDMDALDGALSRILKVKQQFRPERNGAPDHAANRAMSQTLVERSITLVRDTHGTLPLDPKTTKVILAGDKTLHDSTPLRRNFEQVVPLDEVTAIEGETVLFAIFTSVAAWKGSSGIDARERESIRELLRKTKRSAVVSFGSPYVLRYFNDAAVMIAAYEATEAAQIAAIRCMQGERPFVGRLPVTIPMNK